MRSRYDYFTWEVSWPQFYVECYGVAYDTGITVPSGSGTILDLVAQINTILKAAAVGTGVSLGFRPAVATGKKRLDRYLEFFYYDPTMLPGRSVQMTIEAIGADVPAVGALLGLRPGQYLFSLEEGSGLGPNERAVALDRQFGGAWAAPLNTYGDTRSWPEQDLSLAIASQGPPSVVLRGSRTKIGLYYQYLHGALVLEDRALQESEAGVAGIDPGDINATFQRLWSVLSVGGTANYYTMQHPGGDPADIYNPSYWYSRAETHYVDYGTPQEVYFLDETCMRSLEGCLEDRAVDFNADRVHLKFNLYHDGI